MRQQKFRFMVCLPCAALFAGLVLDWPPAAAQSDDDPRYVIVDGHAVHGYSNGQEIGYQWYPTPEEAERARREMLQLKTSTGPYYDEVVIRPERRRVPRSSLPAARRPPAPTDDGARASGRVFSASDLALRDTIWVGQETARDTTSLRFELKKNGEAVAYDDTAHTWRGKWSTPSASTVLIQLTYPHAVNYAGKIRDGRITGQAHRPGGRGEWTWSVKQR